MISYLLIANVFALVTLVAALVRLTTLKVEHTVGGRAALLFVIVLILLAAVGLSRRAGWIYWPDAQAIAWTIAGFTACGIAFTRSRHHHADKD